MRKSKGYASFEGDEDDGGNPFDDYVPPQVAPAAPATAAQSTPPPQAQAQAQAPPPEPAAILTDEPALSFVPVPASAPVQAPTAAGAPTTTPAPPSAEIERKKLELERKEHELRERERALKELEATAATTAAATSADQPEPPTKTKAAAAPGAVSGTGPNWPPRPFPKQFVRQVWEELPDAIRPRVRMCYLHWICTIVLLVYNLACAIAMVAGDSTAIADLIISIIYIPLWTVLAFLIYRSLYRAARTSRSLTFLLFFVFFGVQILVHVAAVVGWNKSGFLGLKWMIDAFADSHKTAGFMCLANFLLWALSVCFCVYLWIHVRIDFKRAGGLKAAGKQAG
jgi:hypothetical protein